ncbi:hypothetical protein LTR08_004359 [Meristemomyces frigidus]|nr:hypothetical protein LTR08_004359 [Meristemomyces frigidus]
MADTKQPEVAEHYKDPASTTKAPVIVETKMRQSRMTGALLAENPRPFRKSFLKLYLYIFVGYLYSATNGFDANTFGGLTAIPTFIDYFGITATNEGLVAALYVIGNIAGFFFAGPYADMYGRRIGIAIGSAIYILGVVLQAASISLGDL